MLGCSHFHGTRSTLKAVAAALAETEQVCLAAGDRWTASRRRTYELLVQAGGPVKAYDLISAYATEGEPVAKPPTVYRALEFLTGKGLVHRIESLNAFLACDAQHDGAAAEFLICDCCGRVEELDVGMQDLAAAAVNARGFRPTRIVLEVHGTCAGCV